jgi:hypothetical protein
MAQSANLVANQRIDWFVVYLARNELDAGGIRQALDVAGQSFGVLLVHFYWPSLGRRSVKPVPGLWRGPSWPPNRRKTGLRACDQRWQLIGQNRDCTEFSDRKRSSTKRPAEGNAQSCDHERSMQRFNLYPARLMGDSAYGSAEMIGIFHTIRAIL